ncbi:fatty acid desaturase family protein [Nocardia sp. NPDC004573]
MRNNGALEREFQKPPSLVKRAVRETSRLDNAHNMLYIAADWGLWISSAYIGVMSDNFFIYVIAVIVIGSRMRALGNLLHEASHHKLFRSRSMNDTVGALLWAWPVAVGYRRYVEQHRLHHVYLWDHDKDPDIGLYLLTGTDEASVDRCPRWKFWVIHVVFAAIPLMPLRRLCTDLSYDRPRLFKLGTLSVLLTGVGICTNLSVVDILISYWLIPFLTSYQTIAYWAEMAEHGGMRRLGKMWGSRNWRGSVVTRWLIGPHSDDSYHLLHHWFPSVPHYRLAVLDRVCVSEWQIYAEHPRCGGFFVSSGSRSSVIDDIWRGPASVDPSVGTTKGHRLVRAAKAQCGVDSQKLESQ